LLKTLLDLRLANPDLTSLARPRAGSSKSGHS
jgi:hypothetical protein